MAVESTASAATSSSSAGKTSKPAHGDSNVKDTIESILVAFILAFIFRAFVVEAFVIPTGSMAPTLLGAHMRFRCADCGYQWTVNPFSDVQRDEENIPPFAVFQGAERAGRPMVFAKGYEPGFPVYCPNCAFPVQHEYAGDTDNDATMPAIHYGDRILVLKYAYLFRQPDRWDVVVFKSPHEQKPDPSQPKFAQNYIKRLVGRPGESIMVLDGDIYVAPADTRPFTSGGVPGARLDPNLPEWSKFEIQRKPHVVQSALWRTVYDNDYIPQGLKRPDKPDWKQPWTELKGQSGWDLHSGTPQARVFDFKNPGDGSTIEFDASANPDTNALTDWLPYDQIHEQWQPRLTKPSVSDLKIDCFYERVSGDGALRLVLVKGSDTFTAEITRGKAVIKRTDGKDRVTEFPGAGEFKALTGGRPVRLEFENVDYRVSLRVDGDEVASTGDAYRPNVQELLVTRSTWPPAPTARIAAERQECRLSHLKLARDVYYLNGHPGSTPSTWGAPETVINLGSEEYFVLGDNSLISGDARTWIDRVDLPAEDLYVASGRVPARFMLGKAFFVYWPAGYRPWSTAPGAVPNFGQMRFIH